MLLILKIKYPQRNLIHSLGTDFLWISFYQKGGEIDQQG